MVTCSKWHKKESLLDHVYVKNAATVRNVIVKSQIFGDHKLILVELILKSLNDIKSLTVRNWKCYNTITLCAMLTNELALLYNGVENLSVQEHWNVLENVVIINV